MVQAPLNRRISLYNHHNHRRRPGTRTQRTRIPTQLSQTALCHVVQAGLQPWPNLLSIHANPAPNQPKRT